MTTSKLGRQSHRFKAACAAFDGRRSSFAEFEIEIRLADGLVTEEEADRAIQQARALLKAGGVIPADAAEHGRG